MYSWPPCCTTAGGGLRSHLSFLGVGLFCSPSSRPLLTGCSSGCSSAGLCTWCIAAGALLCFGPFFPGAATGTSTISAGSTPELPPLLPPMVLQSPPAWRSGTLSAPVVGGEISGTAGAPSSTSASCWAGSTGSGLLPPLCSFPVNQLGISL